MAHVILTLGDDRPRTLRHGDVVGRLPGVALCVDDPRVSEAHALLSLRGDGFELLALRRSLLVGGRAVSQAPLFAGAQIDLVPGLTLRVDAIVLPDRVPALRDADGTVHMLQSVASVIDHPSPAIVARYDTEAVATIWMVGETVRAQVGDGPSRTLAVGDVLDLGPRQITVVDVPLQHAFVDGTQAPPLVPRLRVEVAYDLARIEQYGQLPLEIHGLGARIIAELVAFGGSAPWHLVASELWRETDDRDKLRERWDAACRRLRVQIRDGGIREDLVLADRGGNAVLRIHPWDEVVDRS